MLTHAVESYLSVRHACGFTLKWQGSLLLSFAAFSEAKGKEHVCAQTAIEWSGLARSVHERAYNYAVAILRFERNGTTLRGDHLARSRLVDGITRGVIEMRMVHK
jgi:integrase/recombinase XerD